MFFLAMVLVLNSLVGPLGLGFIDYPISTTVQNQLIGLEIATLALVAPLSIAAGILALRGHRAAGPVAFGPAAYTAYMFFAQYVLGPEYETFNAVVLFDLGVFAAGAVLAVAAWTITDTRVLPETAPTRQRTYGVVLLALAAFVVSRYLGHVVGGAMPAEFADARTFFWSIVLLDLGLVVPATIASAAALFLRTPSAAKSLYAVIGWFVLVPPSVLSMAAVMVARADSAGSVGQVVVLGVAAVVFVAFAAIVFRPLLSRPRADGSTEWHPGSGYRYIQGQDAPGGGEDASSTAPGSIASCAGSEESENRPHMRPSTRIGRGRRRWATMAR